MNAKEAKPEQPAQRGGLSAAGVTLANAREQQQLDVEAVAAELHLRPEVVRALESGDEARLPSPPFVRGYVKAYARLLGLDENAVVDQLPGVHETNPAPLKRIGIRRRRVALPFGRLLAWSVAVLALLAMAVYGVSALQRLWSGRISEPASDQMRIPLPDDGNGADSQMLEPLDADSQPAEWETPPAAGAADAPVALDDTGAEAATAPPDVELEADVQGAPTQVEAPAEAGQQAAPGQGSSEAQAEGPAVVQLRFSEDSWVEMEARGRKLVVGTQRAGSERTVRVEPPVDLLLGNAPGVEVIFRGKRIELGAYQRGKVARLTLED